MAKEKVLQASFSAGELSPHIHDRIDLDAYSAGCAKLENFIPLPHGPIVRRRGSRFVTEAAASEVRLAPFSFNVDQSFVIEFTHGLIRVISKDGLLGVQVASPYAVSDLANLRWAQNGDWLFLVDGRNAPKALKRYSNADWRLEDLVFTAKPAEWVDGNHPKMVALFEQRAYYLGTHRQPQQVWASRTGLYENFTMSENIGGETTVLDDHAFTYTIFSDDTNGIEWVLPMSALVIGTAGAEFKMGSSSAIDPVTPKNVRISVQTKYGSASTPPVQIGTSVIFTQRSRNRVRAFEYSFQEDQYNAQDLTIFANHVLNGKVKEMRVQTSPDSYVWLVTETGELVGCTYEKKQKVLAWHTHRTDGAYTALCVLPMRGNDQVFVAVKREINGQQKTYIEVFIDAWESQQNVGEAFYVDSGLTYAGEPTNVLTGLGHLEGRTVSVLIDGWVHPDVIVSNGQVVLRDSGSYIHVGLPYTSEFISLVPQSQSSVSVGSSRRISEANIALENSADFSYAEVSAGIESIAYNGPSKIMDKAVPFTSRHQRVSIASKTGVTNQLKIWQDKPVPLTIRGITYTINPSDI